MVARWGEPNEVGASGDQLTLQVVRADADAQAKSVAYGSIGSATFALDTGPWNLNASTTGSSFSGVVDITATLLCYTNSGTR